MHLMSGKDVSDILLSEKEQVMKTYVRYDLIFVNFMWGDVLRKC